MTDADAWPPPWPPAYPDPAKLLDTVEAFCARFIAYPTEHARVAHVLWIMHAWLMDCWDSTPRIAFLSPEPGSGKTRALEVTELLVPRPLLAVNVTPAYLFRKVGDPDGLPTVLFDEIDTVFGPKAKDNEEIRALLNAGHRRSGVAGRCVVRGHTVGTEEIPAYSAVAIAGLGKLPDTILSRSVVIRMRRRAPDEPVEPFRTREHTYEAQDIRADLATWAADAHDAARAARPEMPDGVADRDADVWEPLLAVADVSDVSDSGSVVSDRSWPIRARVSAVSLVSQLREDAVSLGMRLLEDLRTIFNASGFVSLTSTYLLTELKEIDEAPWDDLRGKSLDPRGLAKLLKPYGISSITVRVDGKQTARGYRREDLHDAWTRYLSPLPDKCDTSDTADTASGPGLFTPGSEEDECPF